MSRVALAVLALGGGVAFAQTQMGQYVTLSGFGTLGAVSKSGDGADFVRYSAPEGAGSSASWKVDSKLGLQANVTINDWLSGTVQVLSEQRNLPRVDTDFEWAFVKVKPLDGLSVRVGRTAPAQFMVSDTRNVGYANVMVRQPNEVYALAGMRRLDGMDVSYATKLGGTTLTVQAMGGESQFLITGADFNFKMKNVRGLNAVWETSLGSFRVGQTKLDLEVPRTFSRTGVAYTTGYTFTGIGYIWDDGQSVVSAEMIRRTLSGASSVFNTRGWYVMGGYRFGSVLPYAMVAGSTAANPTLNITDGSQRTYALGVRWDAVSNAALKVQYEHVDPKGTRGASFSTSQGRPARKSNVLSVAVDFTF